MSYVNDTGLDSLIKKVKTAISNSSSTAPAASGVIEQYWTRRYIAGATPLPLGRHSRIIFTDDYAQNVGLSNYGNYTKTLEWTAPSNGIVLVYTSICSTGASYACSGVMQRVLHEGGEPYWRMRAGNTGKPGYVDVGIQDITTISHSVIYNINNESIYTYETQINFDIYTGEKVCMFYDNCSDIGHKLINARMTVTFMPGGRFINDMTN